MHTAVLRDLRRRTSASLRGSSDRITREHLLTHSSGIPEYVARDSFFTQQAPAPHTVADLIARFASLPLEFPPGTRWSYSNSNYVLLAAIIERVSGPPYSALLSSLIGEPLGMRSLAIDDESVVKG